MTDDPNTAPGDPAPGAPSDLRRLRHRTLLAAGLAGLIALGGAVHLARGRPAEADLAALTPAPIAAMKPASMVAAKGEVAEIFGNKLILQDASGRALVDLGPRGDDDASPVHKGETLQARGRFDHGVLHAAIIETADGRRVVLGPPPPPRPPRPDLPRC